MSAKATSSQPEPAEILRDASLNTLPARQEERRAELYAFALEYIGLGIAVFPLSHVTDQGCSVAGTPHCKCKGNLEHAGKCQVLDHWSEQASTDRDQIDDWWGPEPRYEIAEFDSFGRGGKKVASAGDHVIAHGTWFPLGNIGLSMRDSGILGVDVDPRHGGRESADALLLNGIDLYATRTHDTPSGGTHSLFAMPGDFEPRNYYAKPRGIARGIDLIGKGFLYAPPSIVGMGVYQARIPKAEIGDAPAYITGWIRDRARECQGLPVAGARPPAPDGRRRRYGAAALAGEKKLLAECQDGRNNQLNNSALSLGSLSEECSVSYEEAYDTLMQACEVNGLLREDGLGQCTASFRSGWHTGLRSPRHIEYRISDDRDRTMTARSWLKSSRGRGPSTATASGSSMPTATCWAGT